MTHKDLTAEEWAERRKQAEFKLGRPFITHLPVKRAVDKSSRLREIETMQKEEARRNKVVNFKKDAK